MAAQIATDHPDSPTQSPGGEPGHCRLCTPLACSAPLLPTTPQFLFQAIAELLKSHMISVMAFLTACYLHKHGQICFFIVPWRSITASSSFPTRSVCNLNLTSWLCWVHFHRSSFYPHSNALLPLYCYFPRLESTSLHMIFPESRHFIVLRKLTLAVPGNSLSLGQPVSGQSLKMADGESGVGPWSRHGPRCRHGQPGSQDRWNQGRELQFQTQELNRRSHRWWLNPEVGRLKPRAGEPDQQRRQTCCLGAQVTWQSRTQADFSCGSCMKLWSQTI